MQALGPKIRALLVDDSAVARRAVAQVLSAQPDIEVVGSLDSGIAALEHVDKQLPDVVVLDLEMPNMDGIETLRELKKRAPRLPVLIFSSLTKRGAGATVDALLAGADDYALKPSVPADASSNWALTQAELTSKLRAITRHAREERGGAVTASLAPAPSLGRASGAPWAPIEAIVIGTSIGGPEALAVILPRLPATLSVPIFIVQHMPSGFTGALAKRLDERSSMRVVEASHGQLVRPGVAVVAAGDFHLQLSRRHRHVSLLLDRGPLENGCRPSVDPLFRSAATIYGPGLLAIVLTGMGSDGLLGARNVTEHGGNVWVQDERSAVVWGMAGAVARAGLARRIVPLISLAPTIEAALAHGLPSGAAGAVGGAR